MFEVRGKVVYNDFEGGFWGIVGNDGRKYCPESLPSEFQRKGLAVVARLERTSGVSFRMWGIPVRIERISRDDA